MADGFVLNIPQEMVDRLTIADQKIEKLGNVSETTSKKVVNAFRHMTEGGVNEFIQSLNTAQQAIDKLSQTKIDSNKTIFTNMSQQIWNAVDGINVLKESINQLQYKEQNNKVKFNLTEDTKKEGSIQKRIDDFLGGSANKGTITETIDVQLSTGGAIDQVNVLMQTLQKLASQMNATFSSDAHKSVTSFTNSLKELTNALNSANPQGAAESTKRSVVGLNVVNETAKNTYKALNRETKKMVKTYDKLHDAMRDYKNNSEVLVNRLREARQAFQDFNNAAKQAAQQDAGSFEGLAKNAKTLNELKHLASQLKHTMADLDPNSKEWARLNEIYKQTNKQIKNINNSMKEMSTRHKSLFNQAMQLRRALMLAFSVSQVTGYLRKMIDVRGEFELQQRSLQAIIQNKDKANEIWNKTVALAVKSPFQVKELVSYTKQLAAYRVESDKLFDTTKMLADVSAGLGVDMQRLILAYGQVKAANYLRGTELRQFSEAGINILEELAKYFTEIEGRAVSTGDVFERVSKRMVTFGDVAEIFKRVTREGGTFYKMQEIQAETLKGQISNLKDSYELMLNEIGKSTEGSLKNGVAFTRKLIENWETIADIIKVIIPLLAIYKINTIASSKATLSLAQSLGVTASNGGKMLTVLQLLKVGFKNIGSAIKSAGIAIKSFFASNFVLLSIAALVTAIHELIHINDELNASIDEIYNRRDREITQLKEITKQYQKLKELKTDDKDSLFGEQKKVFAELQNYADENQINIPVRLEDITAENIDDVFKRANELIRFSQNFGADLGAEMAKGFNSTEGWFNIFGDNLLTDLEQFDKSVNEMSKGADFRLETVMKEIESYDKLSPQVESLYNSIKEGQKSNETEVEFLMRKIEYLGIIQRNFKAITNDQATGKDITVYELRNQDEILRAEKLRNKVISKRLELSVELKKVADRITKDVYNVEDFSKLTKEQQLSLQPQIDKAFLDTEVSEASKIIAAKMFAEQVKIPYVLVPAQEEEEQLKEWQKEYNAKIDTLQGKKPFKITQLEKSDEDLRDEHAKRIKELKESIDFYEHADNAFQKAEKSTYELNKAELKNTEIMYKWLGGYEEATDESANRMRPLIDLIREMNKEYKKLNHTFDEFKSKQKVLDSYKESFAEIFEGTGINISDIDFTSEEGVVKSLNKLQDLASDYGKKAKEALKRAISQVEVDIDVQLKKDQSEDLRKDLEDMIGEYQMSLELQKMDISPKAAKDFFGIDTLSLPQLKDIALQFRKQAEGTDDIAFYDNILKKLDKMEIDAQQERLKKYLKYTREAVGKRAEIKIDEMKKLQEIEEHFKPKKDASQKEIKAMAEARVAAIIGVQKETQRLMQKYDWDEFQKTDTFRAMFDDLDKTSNMGIKAMIDSLEKFKEQWTDMPLDQMKKVIDLLNKLNEEQSNRAAEINPFARMRNIKKEIKDNESYGSSVSDAEKQMRESEQIIANAQKQIDMMNVVLEQKREGVKNDILRNKLGNEYNNYIGESVDSLEDEIDKQENIVKTNTKDLNLSSQQKKRLLEIYNLYQKQSQALSDISKLANDLYGAFSELGEALGVDENSELAIFADMGMDMTNVIMQAIQMRIQVASVKAGLDAAGVSAEAFGYALNTAMGVIGWIVMAVQLLAKGIAAIVKAHDNRLQKQIERDAEAVEILEEKYENLADAIDSAMSFEKYNADFKSMQENLERQIELGKQMLAAEEDKKRKDKEAIKSLKEGIRDDEKELSQLTEKFKADMGGFGTAENMYSQAEDFVNAWYDAFKETGNGIDALGETYDNMLDKLLKKQLFMKVADKYISNLTKQIDNAIGEDGIVTKEELQQLINAKDTATQELNTLLTQLSEQLGITSGTNTGLEGLSENIQGVTEITAQALEALLNSMRFYVADTNMELKSLAESFNDFNINGVNNIIAELKNQTYIIEEMRSMFDSVIVNSNVQGGKGKALVISM